MKRLLLLAAIAALAPFGAWAQTAQDLVKGSGDTSDVLNYGMGYNLQRHSPISIINKGNVGRLVAKWNYSYDDNRAEESQPLVYQGVLYVTTNSATMALDAKTGKQIWKTKVEYPPETPRIVCCGIINRGAALYDGKVFRTTLDANVIALDAKTGKELWRQKAADIKEGYSMTVAPLVADGVVITGISGAEFGTRDFLDGWDPATGQHKWRTYTVPAAGEPGSETWPGDTWQHGGGSTWITGSFDPELHTVYWGVGNPGPFNAGIRKGDNLYTCAVIALDPQSGKVKWHFQFSPNNPFDYDSVAEMVLADVKIGGKPTKVLMDANRNGFLYVLDRTNGKLLAANPYIEKVNWASGVDLKTGRPIENAGIRYDQTGKPTRMLPGALGAHSWQAMAFNPKTGLVYIPAQEVPMTFIPVKDFKPASMGWNIGVATNNPRDVRGYLLAWDPLNQKEVWRANYLGPWNGGVLTTAGNLVIQGNAAGYLSAYRADTGEKLWSMSAQTAVMAAPVSYEIDGEQYIAVLAGWGGGYPLMQGRDSGKSGNERNVSRMLVFKLGGSATLPQLEPRQLVLNPPADIADAPTLATGGAFFGRFCSVCHGENAVGGGVVPDLRASSFLGNDFFYEIVLNGAMKDNGMASFKSILDHQKAESIRAYLIHRANEDKRTESASQDVHAGE